ncbi:MAG: Carbohydrate binding family 6 [Planctomycetaceae bacterium]|nr:Carbohydrate binding family 6 [Planctomycetaceae bacterium]
MSKARKPKKIRFSDPRFIRTPTELLAIVDSSTRVINLTWTAAGGSATYLIERATLPSREYIALSEVSAGTTFADANVEIGTSYCYRVRAVVNGVSSTPSATVIATMLPPQTFARVYGSDGVPSGWVAIDMIAGMPTAQSSVITTLDSAPNQVLKGADITIQSHIENPISSVNWVQFFWDRNGSDAASTDDSILGNPRTGSGGDSTFTPSSISTDHYPSGAHRIFGLVRDGINMAWADGKAGDVAVNLLPASTQYVVSQTSSDTILPYSITLTACFGVEGPNPIAQFLFYRDSNSNRTLKSNDKVRDKVNGADIDSLASLWTVTNAIADVAPDLLLDANRSTSNEIAHLKALNDRLSDLGLTLDKVMLIGHSNGVAFMADSAEAIYRSFEFQRGKERVSHESSSETLGYDTTAAITPTQDEIVECEIRWIRTSGDWIQKPTSTIEDCPFSLDHIERMVENAELRSIQSGIPQPAPGYEGWISISRDRRNLNSDFLSSLEDRVVDWLTGDKRKSFTFGHSTLRLRWLTADQITGIVVPSVLTPIHTPESPAKASEPPDPNKTDSEVLALLNAIRNLRQGSDFNNPLLALQRIDEMLPKLRQLVWQEIAAVFECFTDDESFSKLRASKKFANLMDYKEEGLRFPLRTSLDSTDFMDGRSDASENELSLVQKEMLDRLNGVIGTDSVARDRAQEILDEYVGMPTTKKFVNSFKTFLKDRRWGIQTSLGVAAAPVWQPDRGRPAGGYMRLSFTHPETGLGAKSESYAKLRPLLLVERPDQRRSKHT